MIIVLDVGLILMGLGVALLIVAAVLAWLMDV
jgi:hypothetical protein